MKSSWTSFSILFLVLAIAVPVSAQVGKTEMTGVVTDASGAVLPGVTVTATLTGRGITRTAVTGADGRYAFTQLDVGTYAFVFMLDGFEPGQLDGMELNVGQRPTVNVVLQLAGVSEAVTVTAVSPVIETTRSELTHVIQDVQVEELPILGRDWLGFAVIAAGVKSDGSEGSQDSAPTAGIGIGRQDKVLIDGSDVNNRSTSSGIDIKLSKETIAEFEVKTNQFDAQLGQSGTSITQAVTKSGTDAFSGSGFYYRRDGNWNAEDFFTGEKDEDFSTTQVGGTFGGPIAKSKAFFFVSYEYQETPRTLSSNTGITLIDQQRVDAGDERNLWFIRGDFQVNQDHRAAFRYNRSTRLQPAAGTGGGTAPIRSTNFDFAFDRYNFSLDSVLGGDKVNRLIVNYMDTGRLFGKRGDVVVGPDVSPKITTAGANNSFPSVNLGGSTGGGFENPDYWSIRDDLSTFFEAGGVHNFKVGGYYERATLQGFFLAFTNGNFFYDEDPANIQTCCVSENQSEWDKSQFPEATRYQQNLGEPSIDTEQNFISFFVQDDWTLNNRLTLNLGLRYDLETGSLMNDQPGALLQPEFGDDVDNFQPRIGFAYDLTGDSQTVLRGGVGRFSSQAFLNIALLVQRSNRTQELNVAVQNDGTNPNFNEDPLEGRTFEDFQDQIGISPIDIAIFPVGTEIPDLWSFSMGVAHQLAPSMGLEIDYVHQRTNSQFLAREGNLFSNDAGTLPLPVVSGNFPELGGDVVGAGRPDPRFNSISEYRNEGRSRYHGVSVAFTKRFDDKYSVGATYLLSHNEDNTDAFDDFPSNPFDLEDEYGTSIFDQRHRVTANWVWQMPYDFIFSGLIYGGSGRGRPSIANGQDLYGTAPPGRGLNPRPTCGLDPRYDSACSSLGLSNGTRIPRNAVRSDSVFRVDFRLGWRFYAADGVFIEPTLEIFNVFNRENYDPTAYGSNVGSGAFNQPGRSGSQPYSPRNIQLGVIVRF